MSKYFGIDIVQFIKLNYLSKNVIRNGKGKIIPFWGAHVELRENSRLILHDDSLEAGVNRVKGSKSETLIRLHEGASWIVNGYCGLSYGVTIEINENANMESGYFTSNSNSVIVANKSIRIGNDVMIGRNVTIYDSDFHSLNNRKDNSESVIIGDHVWIATNAMVLKGVHIETGSVIAAGTIVKENVPERSLVASDKSQKVVFDNVSWKR